MFPGERDQHLTETIHGIPDHQQFLAEPEAQTGRNLVVSGPADMEPPALFDPDLSDQQRFYSSMDILELFIERIFRDPICRKSEEDLHHSGGWFRFDDPLPVQHQQVSNVDQHICLCDPVVRIP
jgi:hypothetical protein